MMGSEHVHRSAMVQRNLITARDLRAAYVYELMLGLKVSAGRRARSRFKTWRDAITALSTKSRQSGSDRVLGA
jgi:hypothetical protein